MISTTFPTVLPVAKIAPLPIGSAIDVAGLVMRCLNNTGLALALLEAFEASGKPYLDTIERMAGGEPDSAADPFLEMVHSLKSAAGIICADALRSKATEVEAAGRVDQRPIPWELIRDLKQELVHCLDSLPDVRSRLQTWVGHVPQ